MKCIYCGSYNTDVAQTHANSDFVPAERLTTYADKTETGMTILPITRRKCHCKDCGEYFFTIELYEGSTRASKHQFYVQTNVELIEAGGKAKYEPDEEEKKFMDDIIEARLQEAEEEAG